MILPTENTYNIFRIIFILAWAVATARIFYLLFLLNLGKKEERVDKIFSRIVYFIKNVVFGAKIFEDPLIGAAHLMIFWGFLCFAVVSINAFLEGFFPGAEFFPAKLPVVIYIVDIFAVLVMLGLLIAAIRRYIIKPDRLENTPDAFVCLFLIFFLMITYVFGEAFFYKAIPSFTAAKGIAGSYLSSLLTNISAQDARKFYIWTWWSHILCILFFLNYIFFSKHLHLAACPFNSFLARKTQKGCLPAQKNADTPGVGRANEFTWKDLLDGYACSECGRCDRFCPAYNSGLKLSPKMIIHNIKEHLLKDGAKLLSLKKQRSSLQNKESVKSIIGNYITKEELWNCFTCYSCVERCPVSNDHVTSIIKMRRRLVNNGELDELLGASLMNFANYGNSFGKPAKQRAKWTADLSFKIKDARSEEVDYLWFVGDYASFDTAVQPSTKLFAQVLNSSGVSFGILHEAEKNSGADVRRTGEEGCFEILVEENLETLKSAKFKKIVTTDPHTFNALKNEYPSFGANYEVIHYTQLLEELMNSGKIKISKKLNYNATFHDPCYLGRYNGIFSSPRNIIKSLGIKLIEMPRNKSYSFCCGAGGGKIWMEEATMKERPSESRIKEAALLTSVNYFITACPKDLTMFNDAVKTTGNEDKIFVKDIIELIAEAT